MTEEPEWPEGMTPELAQRMVAHLRKCAAEKVGRPNDLHREMLELVAAIKIEHSGCSCLEVFGENVDCPEHGIASEWSVENRDPEEWQGIALGLERLRAEATAALIAAAREREAMRKALGSIAEYWNRDRNDSAMHDACWHAINTAEEALASMGEAQ